MVTVPPTGAPVAHRAFGRLLVLRFSSAGDVLLTAPALQALRAYFPRCHITFVTRAAFAPLVRGQPHIDAVRAQTAFDQLTRLEQCPDLNALVDLLTVH